MSTPDQPDLQADYLNGLSKITREIVQISAGGDYIYRGEPKEHKKPPYCGRVSSNLWRKYPDIFDLELYSIEDFQKKILKEVRNYPHERGKKDFEILNRTSTLWQSD